MKIRRVCFPLLVFITILAFIVPGVSSMVKVLLCLSHLFCIIIFLPQNKHSEITYLKWLFIFLFFCILSVLWALERRVSLWVILMQQFPIYSLCTSSFLYIRSKTDLISLLKCIYFASVFLLLAVASLTDFSSLDGSRLYIDTADDSVWNPNFIGLDLAFGSYAGFFAIIKNGRSRLLKLFWAITTLVMIVAILLSGSRSALITLVAPLIIYSIYGNNHAFAGLLIVSSLLVALFVSIMEIPVLYSNIGVRIEEMINIFSVNGDGSGDDSRLILVLSGLTWFMDNPIFGVGINNFRVLSSQRLPYAIAFYAHNNYVELLVDIGLVGFIIYYFFVILLHKEIKTLPLQEKRWVVAFSFVLLLADVTNVSYYEVMLQLVICILFSINKINRINRINTKELKYESN